jgi:uncharacterized membrane protein YdjX (TVP38/TMEM64 family)
VGEDEKAKPRRKTSLQKVKNKVSSCGKKFLFFLRFFPYFPTLVVVGFVLMCHMAKEDSLKTLFREAAE